MTDKTISANGSAVTRGFAVVALVQPKTDANVGSALRAACAFGAAQVVVSGRRYRSAATDTTKAWRHMPVTHADQVMDAIPMGCVPVAVEITDDARCLTTYQHPERAFYIFGPEDGSIPKAIIARCRDVVSIPTAYCLNLAAAVNVVLYDRALKSKDGTK